MATITLTEEQAKFLEECEKEFKDRYTENDQAFMEVKNMKPKKPPIQDPWYNKQQRPPNDWVRQNHGRRNYNFDRRPNERESYVQRNKGRHYGRRYGPL